MAAAAILKNPKITISQQRFDRSTRNLAQLRIFDLRTGPAVKISNFYKSKMADGHRLEKLKNVVWTLLVAYSKLVIKQQI